MSSWSQYCSFSHRDIEAYICWYDSAALWQGQSHCSPAEISRASRLASRQGGWYILL